MDGDFKLKLQIVIRGCGGNDKGPRKLVVYGMKRMVFPGQ